MSYRGGPRTLSERVADIEEQLRRANSIVVQTVVVTDHGGLDGLGDDDHGQYQLRSEQGDVDGYPDLDGSGLVPKAQLPTDVVYTADLPSVTDPTTLVWLTMTEGL